MSRLPVRPSLRLVLAMLALYTLTPQTVAWAQAGDGWSFIITPQIWATHVAQNGFVSPSTVAGIILRDASGRVIAPLFTTDSRPADVLAPQWGVQLAAQKGRWTLAGSFQYVTFETRTDFTYSPPSPNLSPICVQQVCLSTGDRFAQEFVNTTRMDTDFGASYVFPDVVKDWLDFSLGAGLKIIYASASREFNNMSTVAAIANAGPPSGLYLICKHDNCSDFGARDRVKTKDWLYGATIPMSGVVHLTRDSRWLLPLSITPFLGAETRNDRDVVYRLNEDFTAKRLDGTTFAYGVTADASVRYVINDTLSAYAGMRVQYIKGHEQYLAYGPLVGMSVRFGGK